MLILERLMTLAGRSTNNLSQGFLLNNHKKYFQTEYPPPPPSMKLPSVLTPDNYILRGVAEKRYLAYASSQSYLENMPLFLAELSDRVFVETVRGQPSKKVGIQLRALKSIEQTSIDLCQQLTLEVESKVVGKHRMRAFIGIDLRLRREMTVQQMEEQILRNMDPNVIRSEAKEAFEEELSNWLIF